LDPNEAFPVRAWKSGSLEPRQRIQLNSSLGPAELKLASSNPETYAAMNGCSSTLLQPNPSGLPKKHACDGAQRHTANHPHSYCSVSVIALKSKVVLCACSKRSMPRFPWKNLLASVVCLSRIPAGLRTTGNPPMMAEWRRSCSSRRPLPPSCTNPSWLPCG